MDSTIRRDLVVVAASAGGISALQRLLGSLPGDLPAALLVVLHLPPRPGSALPKVLERAGPFPAEFGQDGAELVEGRVFVAPPDRHLLVQGGVMRLSEGPRQNGLRPAADPLLFSVALSAGPRAVAVVLSGSRDDGAAGAAAVERHGGLVLVQDPKDAQYQGMPQAALAAAVGARAAPMEELALLLDRAVREPVVTSVHDDERTR